MFSSYVQPICLWNEKNDPTQTEGHIGGWGQSQNLENFFEEITIVDLASNRTFCAGRGDGTGVCDGDSGGGVSIIDGSTFYFRGIVSSGLRNQISCDVTKFSIFTDVLKFRTWIDQIISEDGDILIPKVVQRSNVRCTIISYSWKHLVEDSKKDLLTCRIYDQKIDHEGFSVAGYVNQNIQAIGILKNKEVKFLPENIGESSPGLIGFLVINCSIKTVNGKHCKGLNKLEVLILERNEIESIEGDSFKDLTKLDFLNLAHNEIQTLDPNLFQSLEILSAFAIPNNQIEFLDEKIFVKLRNVGNIELTSNKLTTIPKNLFKHNLSLGLIWLNGNKIQTISSTMFDHLSNLSLINLRNNVCVNGFYLRNRFDKMKNLLSRNCTLPV